MLATARYLSMPLMVCFSLGALVTLAAQPLSGTLQHLVQHQAPNGIELLALTWATVDLDGASVEVRGNLQRIERKLTITAPKTDASRRHVALTSLAVDALRRHRVRHAEERLAKGPLWDDLGLIFCRGDGSPLEGTSMLRTDFYPLLERAGLPRVRFHDLRHSTATLLMSLGIDLKIISEILGHSSVRITGDVYTHVSLEMQRPAAHALDTLLRRRQANV